MKSVGVRLALWYALASVLTLALLFRAGRYLLEQHVIQNLDLLNAAQLEQIKERFGPEPAQLTPAEIRERMRETNELTSTRFYIEIHRPGDAKRIRTAEDSVREAREENGDGEDEE